MKGNYEGVIRSFDNFTVQGLDQNLNAVNIKTFTQKDIDEALSESALTLEDAYERLIYQTVYWAQLYAKQLSVMERFQDEFDVWFEQTSAYFRKTHTRQPDQPLHKYLVDGYVKTDPNYLAKRMRIHKAREVVKVIEGIKEALRVKKFAIERMLINYHEQSRRPKPR